MLFSRTDNFTFIILNNVYSDYHICPCVRLSVCACPSLCLCMFRTARRIGVKFGTHVASMETTENSELYFLFPAINITIELQCGKCMTL
jgi:hypothetical protein